MYRIAIEKLLKWKESKRRKPLIIEGARQVGKTWLMKEFGRLYYTDTVYINFDSNSRMAELFASDLDTERLIMGLELYSGRKIDPDHTLLIFDEVQEVPRALSSLKYFYENAPEYHIVCAGSLLGIALHEGTSFPVGKVDFLKLFPLSFKEFLMAAGKERYAELLSKQDYPMITSFKQTYIDALKLFLVDVGLLGCMAGLRQRTLLDGSGLFIEFKAALTEQYVCLQLKTIEDLGVYYYTNDRGSCEIDFIVDTGEQVIPVEVRAEINLRAKSLKTYQEKFTPEIAVRSLMADFKKEDRLVNLPLYAVEEIAKL